MKNLSIRLKLLVTMGGLFLVGVSLILLQSSSTLNSSSDFSVESMSNSLKQQAEHRMGDLGGLVSSEINGFLSDTISVTKTLAKQMNLSARENGGKPLSRLQVKQLNQSALLSNDNISAIYTQLEPNAYDGADSLYIGNLDHSSNTGTLEIYFYREDGEVVYSASEDPEIKYASETDDYGIREAEWYLCSLDRVDACLLDPYLYEVSEGNEVLMTTYTEPLIVNGAFGGVIGIDVDLPVIQEKVSAIQTRLYDGQGHITIVSQKGLLVASTEKPDALADLYTQHFPEYKNFIAQDGIFISDDYWYFVEKIQLNGNQDIWKVIVSIPNSAILGPVIQTANELNSKKQKSLAGMMLVSVVVVAVSLIILFLLVKTMVDPIKQLSERMLDLADQEGDLTQLINIKEHSELIDLSSGFNRFNSKLRSMIQSMLGQSEILTGSSNQLQLIASSLHDTSENQKEKIQTVVTAINELLASSNSVSDLANDNASFSSKALEQIEVSQNALLKNSDRVSQLSELLQSAENQVGQVEQKTQDIYGILKTIRGIAEQTNLLALNAAIEAARAGEQGRGFAVVADEVRNLASSTQKSTLEIDSLIESLKEEVASAVQQLSKSQTEMQTTLVLTKESSDALEQAVEQVQHISDGALQVASAASEQSRVSEELNRDVTLIGDSTRDLNELSASSSQKADETREAVKRLNEQLNLFKT